jgi:IPT/TIG domain
LVCAIVVLLSLVGCASASAALNLTGTWSAVYHCEIGTCAGTEDPATDTLTQAEGSEVVTGSNGTETITGTLKGNTFEFVSTAPGGYEAKATLTVAANGQSWSGPLSDSNSTSGTYTATRIPNVTGLNPNAGPYAGGTEVTIQGDGFAEGASVRFGPSPASNVRVNSAESITAISPAGNETVDVVVTTSSGTSAISSADKYGYGRLGGLDLNGYCESLGDDGDAAEGEEASTLTKEQIGPEDAYNNWACVESSGARVSIATAGTAPSMDDACSVAFPGVPSRAIPEEPDNAFSWNCFEPAPPEENKGGGEGGGGSVSSGEPTVKAASLVFPAVLVAPLVVPPVMSAPVLAKTGNVAPVSGTVLVKVPGTSKFVPLSTLQQIPFGSIVEATHGTVSVTTAEPGGKTQTGQFFEGEFILRQGSNGIVIAELTGGNFSICPTKRERSHIARVGSPASIGAGSASARAASASGGHVVRKLWANAHGKFSTKGNYAAGAVQGTEWLTEDLCDGTYIKVTRDKVAVTNLVNHHHVEVTTGHHYLAKAPRG